VELCAQDTPDLILMDLIMPKLDGVEATRRIMSENPCAIVVVTADVSHHTSKVFEAMGAGALDAVNTPTLEDPRSPGGANPLLGKIKTIRRLLGTDQKRVGEPRLAEAAHPAHRPHLIAIGASAGGPAALAQVLSELPKNFPAAILIVQHVDSQFMDGLAHWLAQQTKLPVRLAAEGEHPHAGTVLLAGKENHFVFVTSTKLGYVTEPLDSAYRPSIDVFFKSIRQFWRGDVIGILLTGMGRDGAEGLKALHDAGHHTIVQDQATCAVFGMPKVAIELKGATEVLPLHKIGARLNILLDQKH
jgi:chemotaxis response regulator CheB